MSSAQIVDLWKYQVEDIEWFLKNPRSMILYEPRMGKTVVTTNVIARDPNCRSILLACSKNAVGTWIDHLIVWYKHLQPGLKLEIRLIRGKNSSAPAQRKHLYLFPRSADVTVYITSFASLDKDWDWLQKQWPGFDTFIGDEVHKKWRKRQNKGAEVARGIAKRVRRFHALSGSLGGKKGPQDYWAVLNMIDHREFSSYWRFVNRFCIELKNHWGGVEHIDLINVAEFHQLLDKYSRRRFRHVEALWMPKVVRSLIPVQMDALQMRVYDELVADGFSFTEDKMIIAATAMEGVIRMRQLFACPSIFDTNLGMGAAWQDLLDRLADDDEDVELNTTDKHIVIFTPFKQAFPHMRKSLEQAGFKVYQLSGGIEHEEQRTQIDGFKQSKGVMLCTISYAQAFSLVPAQQCFFFGYDFDPSENRQAEDRLIPPTGSYPINAWYYCYKGTHDETIAEQVNQHQRTITLTVGSAVKFMQQRGDNEEAKSLGPKAT